MEWKDIFVSAEDALKDNNINAGLTLTRFSLRRIPRGSTAEKPISTVEIESDFQILRGRKRILPFSSRSRIYRLFENPLKGTWNPLGIYVRQYVCVLPVSLKPNSHSFALCMLWDARYSSLEKKDENITRELILYRTGNMQRFGNMPNYVEKQFVNRQIGTNALFSSCFRFEQ